MKFSDVATLLLLAALWGGSFLFMRVAAPVLGPVWLIEIRMMLAGLALLPGLILTQAKASAQATNFKHSAAQALWSKVRPNIWPLLIVGIFNSALPFTLLAFASVVLPTGFTSILNATSPLFGAGVAAIWLSEQFTLNRLIGMALGFAGVVVLIGWKSFEATPIFVMACVASLTAAMMYAVSAPYIRHRLSGVSPLMITTVSQLCAAIVLLPALPFTVPQAFPNATVVLSVLALALFSTSLAYLLYFRLIQSVGSTQALSVIFLVPMFAMLWGRLFLAEPITAAMVFGCGLVLLGTAFANNLFSARAPIAK